MDKGDIPRDYTRSFCMAAYLSPWKLSVYTSRIGELSCVQGVCYGGECVDAAQEPPPHCVSKHTVKTNCVSWVARVLVCVIAGVQVRAYSQKGLRSYLFKSCTLGLMSDLRDGMKDRLMNA